ncbi:Os03g0643800, partial [Oryza sativa Japonica Group]
PKTLPRKRGNDSFPCRHACTRDGFAYLHRPANRGAGELILISAVEAEVLPHAACELVHELGIRQRRRHARVLPDAPRRPRRQLRALRRHAEPAEPLVRREPRRERRQRHVHVAQRLAAAAEVPPPAELRLQRPHRRHQLAPRRLHRRRARGARRRPPHPPGARRQLGLDRARRPPLPSLPPPAYPLFAAEEASAAAEAAPATKLDLPDPLRLAGDMTIRVADMPDGYLDRSNPVFW